MWIRIVWELHFIGYALTVNTCLVFVPFVAYFVNFHFTWNVSALYSEGTRKLHSVQIICLTEQGGPECSRNCKKLVVLSACYRLQQCRRWPTYKSGRVRVRVGTKHVVRQYSAVSLVAGVEIHNRHLGRLKKPAAFL